MRLPKSRTSDIKKSRKESVLFREIATLFAELTRENAQLSPLMITRVELSGEKKGSCLVFFSCPQGKAQFDELLKVLTLYKPSLRKALASHLNGRYTPEILFVFDEKHEKLWRLESLLESIKEG